MNLDDEYIKDRYEALDMAIKALELSIDYQKVFEDIRADIQAQKLLHKCPLKIEDYRYKEGLNDAIKIIDRNDPTKVREQVDDDNNLQNM